MEREENRVLVTALMQIVPGEHPDVWFEPEDLTAGSIVLIRRESVTCCGFLGGDFIMIIPSALSFASLLECYHAVIPWEERMHPEIQILPTIHERRDKLLHALRSPGPIRDSNRSSTEDTWKEWLSYINQYLWFSSSPDIFRYQMALFGDISAFLTGAVYPGRLIRCLHWWFQNEALSGDKDEMPELLMKKNLYWPDDRNLIIRAINLYNHGAYELSGYGDEGDSVEPYLSGKY